MQAFVVPALRNLREERGTRFVGTVKEIKGRATRQVLKQRTARALLPKKKISFRVPAA
jgi:hypothetical protein